MSCECDPCKCKKECIGEADTFVIDSCIPIDKDGVFSQETLFEILVTFCRRPVVGDTIIDSNGNKFV